METRDKIKDILNGLSDLLLYKNQKYGDSALSPINIFNKGSSNSSILIRLDDKLSRIKNSEDLRLNDLLDLMGYLTLLIADLGYTSSDFEVYKD